MIEFLSYSVFTPKRVGKSYLGIIIIGLGIFVLMMLAGFLIGYLYDSIGIYEIMNSEANLNKQRLYILPYNLLYGVYNKFWLATIICTVLKVDEFKYALPKEIFSMLMAHFKLILIVCLLFSAITEVVVIVVDQIQFDWRAELIRYVIAPIIMVFFIFVMISILDHRQSIKREILSTIDVFKDTNNLIGISLIYLMYVIS